MASGHGVDKPDKAHHPSRKMERMDYQSRTPQEAGNFAYNNAPRPAPGDPYLQRLAQSGRTMTREERAAHYDY